MLLSEEQWKKAVQPLENKRNHKQNINCENLRNRIKGNQLIIQCAWLSFNCSSLDNFSTSKLYKTWLQMVNAWFSPWKHKKNEKTISGKQIWEHGVLRTCLDVIRAEQNGTSSRTKLRGNITNFIKRKLRFLIFYILIKFYYLFFCLFVCKRFHFFITSFFVAVLFILICSFFELHLLLFFLSILYRTFWYYFRQSAIDLVFLLLFSLILSSEHLQTKQINFVP